MINISSHVKRVCIISHTWNEETEFKFFKSLDGVTRHKVLNSQTIEAFKLFYVTACVIRKHVKLFLYEKINTTSLESI